MIKKSYNVRNKCRVKYQIFYHSIELFINHFGCSCEMCEADGDRIVCTDEIIDPLPHVDDKSFYENSHFVNLDIITVTDDGLTNSVKILAPNGQCARNLGGELYTYDDRFYTKCQLCKGYVCIGCFNKKCPKCRLTVIDYGMYKFYKYLVSKIPKMDHLKQLLDYIETCEPEIFDIKKSFRYGVLHDKEIFEWESNNTNGSFCSSDPTLCDICDTYYCIYCFNKCPHEIIHRLITN